MNQLKNISTAVEIFRGDNISTAVEILLLF